MEDNMLNLNILNAVLLSTLIAVLLYCGIYVRNETLKNKYKYCNYICKIINNKKQPDTKRLVYVDNTTYMPIGVTLASYYAYPFNNRPTASGEIYDVNLLTCAHKTLPFGTKLLITNLNNNKSVRVRVNDRGPYIDGRDIDVSEAAAKQLDMIGSGVVKVAVFKIFNNKETD